MSPQIMPSDADVRSNRSDDGLASEEDARLRNDIRLLGRILGDTVRDQEGADVFDLVERIPQGCIAVSESGLCTHEDLAALRQAGFDAFLIGEQLMLPPEPGAALASLLGPRAAAS